MPISTSANSEGARHAQAVVFPTETEIYILSDGRVVVADLPAELNELIAELGTVEPCEIVPTVTADDGVEPQTRLDNA